MRVLGQLTGSAERGELLVPPRSQSSVREVTLVLLRKRETQERVRQRDPGDSETEGEKERETEGQRASERETGR